MSLPKKYPWIIIIILCDIILLHYYKVSLLIIFYFYSIFTVHFSSIDNVFHQLNALVIKTLKYSKTV
jgi:hypothetical protein